MILGPFLLLAVAAVAVYRHRQASIWAPRFSLAFATALAAAWLISGVHLEPWAPLVLAVEGAVLAALAVIRRPASTREPPVAVAE